MEQMRNTIFFYESMTAGRFYDVEQKQILFDFACKMTLLNDDDCKRLKEVIFSSEIESYKDIIDCSNGILMEVAVQKPFRMDILNARREVLRLIGEKMLWDSRTSWLRFLYTVKNDYRHNFEKAVFFLVNGDVQKAKERLAEYAENCDLFSILAEAVLSRNSNDIENEYKYLLLYKTIIEKLYFEHIPFNLDNRIKHLEEKNSQEVSSLVNNMVLSYFDEQSEMKGHIGF